MKWRRRLGFLVTALLLSVVFILFLLIRTLTHIRRKTANPSTLVRKYIHQIEETGTEGRHISLGGKVLDVTYDSVFGVYLINNKPVIWAFWASGWKPGLIRYSLASVLCHNPRFHFQLVTEEEMGSLLDHVHPAFPLLIEAHKADYFRARILDEYGGIYIDADSVGLASFWTLFLKLRWYHIVNISWPPDEDKISIGTLGPMRAHNALTALWVTHIHLRLDSYLPFTTSWWDGSVPGQEYPLDWSALARDICVPIMDRLIRRGTAIRYFSVHGPSTMGQLTASESLNAVSDSWATIHLSLPIYANLTLHIRETELLMYHNSMIEEDLKDVSPASDILMMHLLRLSFRKCGEDDGADGPNPRVIYTFRGGAPLKIDSAVLQFMMEFTDEHISFHPLPAQ